MLNSVGLQGPGLAAWLDARPPGAGGVGRPGRRQHLGPHAWRTTPGRRSWSRRAATSGAGACIVALEVNVSCPNVEDRSRMFAHSADGDGAGHGGHGLRPAPLGQAEPQRARRGGDRRRRARGRGRRADPGQHAARPGPRHRVGPARPRAPAAAGSRAAAVHPVAVRAVWECRAAFPDAADRRRGRGDDRAATPWSCCWPVPTPSRSAPRPSGTPGRRGRCSGSWRAGATPTRTTVDDIRAQARRRARAGAGRPAVDSVGRCTRCARTIAQRRRPRWLTASGTGWPRRCARTGRCAPASTRRPRCWPTWGLSDDAEGLRAFCRTCVEAFAGAVAVVKPQVAFFERHGSAGMARAGAPHRRGDAPPG